MLLSDCLDDYIADDNPVIAVDAFVEELDLKALGFAADRRGTGRPGYHRAVLLKLYIYGCLNRVPSSRRLEREAHRNVELMWAAVGLVNDIPRMRWRVLSHVVLRLTNGSLSAQIFHARGVARTYGRFGCQPPAVAK